MHTPAGCTAAQPKCGCFSTPKLALLITVPPEGGTVPSFTCRKEEMLAPCAPNKACYKAAAGLKAGLMQNNPPCKQDLPIVTRLSCCSLRCQHSATGSAGGLPGAAKQCFPVLETQTSHCQLHSWSLFPTNRHLGTEL